MLDSTSSDESRGDFHMSKTEISIDFVSIMGFVMVTGCGTVTKHFRATGAKASTVSVYERIGDSHCWRRNKT